MTKTYSSKNAGRSQDPNTILESVDDDEYESPVEHAPKKKTTTLRKPFHKSAQKDEGGLQEYAAEAELGS